MAEQPSSVLGDASSQSHLLTSSLAESVELPLPRRNKRRGLQHNNGKKQKKRKRIDSKSHSTAGSSLVTRSRTELREHRKRKIKELDSNETTDKQTPASSSPAAKRRGRPSSDKHKTQEEQGNVETANEPEEQSASNQGSSCLRLFRPLLKRQSSSGKTSSKKRGGSAARERTEKAAQEATSNIPSTSSSKPDEEQRKKSKKKKKGKKDSKLPVSTRSEQKDSCGSSSVPDIDSEGVPRRELTIPLKKYYKLRSKSKLSIENEDSLPNRKYQLRSGKLVGQEGGGESSTSLGAVDVDVSSVPVVKRRSNRGKTTGSCASTSRRSPRGGKNPLSEGGGSSTTAMSAGSNETVTNVSTTNSSESTESNSSNAAGSTASGSTTFEGHVRQFEESLAAVMAAAGGTWTPVMSSGVQGLVAGTVTVPAEAENEETDVGRLQALLEARGLPPHLFGALAPRMQHLLQRSMGNTASATKAYQLLQGLTATGDEGQQLQAVIEMCQVLVMGNEDTLVGFPVKQVVPALVVLLSMEHNFDMMNHACRALTYMMEALPRSSVVVLDAVPSFLQKLQVIQCMDVAEQSLTALEMLSRRHGKSILQAHGVSACLMYLDFFSIVAQRAALAVTANCCQNLLQEEFSLIQPSLQSLISRITHTDKKSVESVCIAFSRIVESYHTDPNKLREIATNELLTNFQQLLVVSPPVISTATFITVLRMLSTMCNSCSDLAEALLKQNIADTLCYLLTGSPDVSNMKDQIEMIPRSPQELYEITFLIGELMPKLPEDGIFSIDAYLEKPMMIPGPDSDLGLWQWKDDHSAWHSYSFIDCRIIEASHQSGEDDVTLTTQGRTYTIDFHLMQQINDETGTTRPIQRKTVNTTAFLSSTMNAGQIDLTPTRTCFSRTFIDSGLGKSFIQSLFRVLYEVYSSSAGPSVRYKCLKALLRMVYYGPPELLETVLQMQQVSSHIAGMMASQDLRIVIGALQMAEILMEKLPHIFETHFTREGVLHQVQQLTSLPLTPSPCKSNGSGSDTNGNIPAGAASATTGTITTSRLTIKDLNDLTAFDIAPSKNVLVGKGVGHKGHNITNRTSATAAASIWGKTTATTTTNVSHGYNRPIYTTCIPMNSKTLRSTINAVDLASTSKGQAASTTIATSDINNAVHVIDNNPTSSALSVKEGIVGESLSYADALIEFADCGPLGFESAVPEQSGAVNLNASHNTIVAESTDSNIASESTFNIAPVMLLGPGDEALAQMSSFGLRTTTSLRLSDVLKRKRTTKRAPNVSRRKQQDELTTTNVVIHDMINRGEGAIPVQSVTSATTEPPPTTVATSNTTTVTAGHSSSTTTTTRSRFSAATLKTSNFLASLNPARWGRNTERKQEVNSPGKTTTTANLSTINRERMKTWVRERASSFIEKYGKPTDSLTSEDSQMCNSILNQLTNTIKKLDDQEYDHLTALKELREIVITSDISAFEVNHSGLVKTLLNYLTRKGTQDDTQERNQRIRKFVHVFANCPLEEIVPNMDEIEPSAMSTLVMKLNGCISQLEQFPVKVHDLPSGSGNTTALRFFNTHQLKCYLQRHPDCNNLRQWRGGTVKIDPLALVQAIERYLVVRGYGRIKDKDSGESEDDNSDDDIDDTLAAVAISQSGTKHKLQFLMGGHVLPYGMTVYQAVKQFSPIALNEFSENEMEAETPVGSANIWVQTHTVYYRSVPEDGSQTTAGSAARSSSSAAGSQKKGKSSSSKSAAKKKLDELWLEGLPPCRVSPLDPFLVSNLPMSINLQDASLVVLSLLRVLHAICRYWGSLYFGVSSNPLLSQHEFVNTKIAAKASRQLQDPLVIMTGNLPTWLQQLTLACPFLLPFETRQLLFYATVFDRDRALQRLLDASPELANVTDTHERVAPRLDRRKRTISREDILKQAETVIHEVATSKALLEVQYEDEVGTGLGPTLEFYALVSKELQRTDLDLWNRTDSTNDDSHVFSGCGLYPLPLGRPTKVSQLVKVKNKFRFLGKFMAKAVMDSRLVDIPFSQSFYQWLLGHEVTLSMSDLAHVNPAVYKNVSRLYALALEKQVIESDQNIPKEQQEEKIKKLTLDGCPIEDLGLDFTLPGHGNVELRKGGKDIAVTIDNLEQYCKLVSHWYLIEGVARQLESFKEGFETVFPISRLSTFFPEELNNVFCGAEAGWDPKMLIESLRPDHGYNLDSKAIHYLIEVLSSYDLQMQRDFLMFVTGSPRLPVGGFKALSPLLTVVRKTLDAGMNPDDYLPSVMTCVNYLKLPDYSSVEVMRDKLRVATLEGQHSFHLS